MNFSNTEFKKKPDLEVKDLQMPRLQQKRNTSHKLLVGIPQLHFQGLINIPAGNIKSEISNKNFEEKVKN